MGWIADLLKEIPSAARYKANLEDMAAENGALKLKIGELSQALAMANKELAQLRAVVADIGPEKEKILLMLAKRSQVTTKQIASGLHMGGELVELYMRELFESDHVTNVLVMGVGALWSLDQTGRRFLLAKGLLK